MADPLIVTTGAVGIIMPVLYGTQLFLEDLQEFKNVPKTDKCLMENVQSVDATLKLLQSVEEREWGLLGEGVAKQLETTISSCTQACDLFRANLQK
jgi:hypothetical protein